MGKPYSEDIRKRVVAAVVTGGLSCNAAAKRFGVAISTAVGMGTTAAPDRQRGAGKMGGHRPKAISGEQRVWMLERIKRDFTLRGLVAELAQRGLKVDYRSVWEFVHAEKLSFKKSVVAGERDRSDVARALPAKSCCPNGRSCLLRHRRASPAFHVRRMRKLSGKLSIMTNLTSSRFSLTDRSPYRSGVSDALMVRAVSGDTLLAKQW
jgi:transposase